MISPISKNAKDAKIYLNSTGKKHVKNARKDQVKHIKKYMPLKKNASL